MKILVTGANGYLGKGIVKMLLDDGVEVVAASVDDRHIDKRANIVIEDIFSVTNPYEYYGKPDVLLHLAWRDGFVHGSINHINDLPKHVDFIKKMIAGGVKQVAMMGSMHEVGFFEGSINENTPCNPQSLYVVVLNGRLFVIDHVHFFRDDIHCGHVVVLRQKDGQREAHVAGAGHCDAVGAGRFGLRRGIGFG